MLQALQLLCGLVWLAHYISVFVRPMVLATTALEVPSGYMSDRLGRRPTLVAAAVVECLGSGLIAFGFAEPARGGQSKDSLPASTQWQLFRNAMAQPVLVWLFSLSVLMYGFSHIPFVFGQPFISEALSAAGWQAEAHLVDGSVSALMMIVSVVASLFAIKLRKRIGLPPS